ncbi:antitoxin VapB family protein [Halorussus amylolyticus]|uniref:antitoxin VapB family protein n=1 Tax=Halorussus amylolyticus TaxID=1126242 RepID=UPI00104F075D|nr:antitoxin VapB family protein [Halorussus amylolyticus]
MATEDRTKTTISLPDEVYDRLEARRRDGESLVEVIDRLMADDEATIYDGFGILAETDIESAVAEVKREMDEDFEKRIDEVSRQ